MDHLIEINKNFNIAANFWELNPQMVIISPFANLYKRDSSKDHYNSSCEAWGIFLFTESSARSKLYRLSEEERMSEINENYYEVDWEDKVIQDCIDRYPFICMSAIEKALKDEEDFIIKRGKFIKVQEYTLDTVNILENGKTAVLPGTAKQLDTMAKASKGIWDNYMKVKAEFVKEEQKSNLRGGRSESKGETGEV